MDDTLQYFTKNTSSAQLAYIYTLSVYTQLSTATWLRSPFRLSLSLSPHSLFPLCLCPSLDYSSRPYVLREVFIGRVRSRVGWMDRGVAIGEGVENEKENNWGLLGIW